MRGVNVTEYLVFRHCEERSDAAIYPTSAKKDGLLRFARNDDGEGKSPPIAIGTMNLHSKYGARVAPHHLLTRNSWFFRFFQSV